ncbi:MAG TPA: hypothetical protein VGU46_05125 [Acidobacteriaceae bacterium]|nr:hypothetical protein [Acidobacteriaceae bacterium]
MDTPRTQNRATRTTHLPVLIALLAIALPAPAQPDPTTLVRQAVQHRLDSAKSHPLHQYLLRRIDEHRDTTKAIIETPEGDVARLILINNKPLTPEANQAELDRLTTLAQHPELQEHRSKSEQKDGAQVTHLLSLLPEALVYTYAGTTPCAASQCTRLTFQPNPHFSPPDLAANIYRGIAGELWIDQTQNQLVKIDAHFIADIDVGFGILGKLNKGGTALLEQSDIGNGDWELTHLNLQVTGKILLVHSFREHVDESLSHFSPIAPTLHYRDAITQLKQLDPTTANAGLRELR